MTHVRASVLIYTLVLVNLALIMALVVLDNAFLLSTNTEIQNVNRTLSAHILAKGKNSIKYTEYLNSNGSGFVDAISCPQSVTMSGVTTMQSSMGTNLSYLSGSTSCTGTYDGATFEIFMNEGLDDFDLATYRGDSVNLIAGVGQSFFSYDSTLISFSTAGLAGIDGIDDDFNSDNYRIDSSSGVYYPNNYVDDDADGRKLVYFFVNPGTGYSNIFWSNTGAAQYIDGNPNNHDTLNLLLGDVSSAYAYLDVNGAFSLKVVKFDKALYESTGEFSVLESIEGRDLVADIGYIQDNAGVASLSDTTTGNEYTFDFLTYDYAIFLQNMQSTPLLFKLTAETPTGTGIYINPVDDSDTNLVKVLANDIILDNDGNYIAKQFEVIGKK